MWDRPTGTLRRKVDARAHGVRWGGSVMQVAIEVPPGSRERASHDFLESVVPLLQLKLAKHDAVLPEGQLQARHLQQVFHPRALVPLHGGRRGHTGTHTTQAAGSVLLYSPELSKPWSAPRLQPSKSLGQPDWRATRCDTRLCRCACVSRVDGKK